MIFTNKNIHYYSPISFIGKKYMLENNLFFETLLRKDLSIKKIKIEINQETFNFYYKFLDWDSSFFNKKIYKIFLIDFNNDVKFNNLILSIEKFLSQIEDSKYVMYFEIPSEDIITIQALCLNKFRLVETRLTYFKDKINSYNFKRFNVRDAELNDLNYLIQTAENNRNNYDRIHADISFNTELADKYIGTYIKNAFIEQFTDNIIVPNINNLNAESFITSSILNTQIPKFKIKIAQMELSAISEKNKGWYIKLVSEMTYKLKEDNIDIIFMNTQSTNKTVIKCWEKLGYKFGQSKHIFSLEL